MYLLKSIFRKWVISLSALLISTLLFFLTTSSLFAEGPRNAEKGIIGRVTSVTTRYVEVDGVRYRLGKRVVVLDERGNHLPRSSLRMAVKVRLEEKNGEVNVIYIAVRTE